MWLNWDLPITIGRRVQLLLITRREAKSQISVIRKCCWWQKSAAGDLASVKSKWRGSMSRAFWSASWQSSRLGLLIPVESFAWWNYLIINMLMANVLAPAGAWTLKKLEGLTRISDLFISTNHEQFVEYFSEVALSLPDSFQLLTQTCFICGASEDPEWRQAVVPSIALVPTRGAQHWCPPKQNIQNAILVNGTLQMYKLAPMHRMHWP